MPVTFNHSVSANQLIRDALLLCGGLGEHETASGTAVTDALRTLNNMVKAWQIKGPLWRRRETVLFLNPGQPSYLLGSATTDAHWTEEYTATLLNGDQSSGATSITVDSTSGMSVGDFIGIELEDGTRQWTTVKTVTSSTVVAIDDALDDDVDDNDTVFFYSDRPERPLHILYATRGEYNGTDLQVDIESIESYLESPSKTTQGTVTLVAYQPNLTSGKFYVWQAPSSCRHVVKLLVDLPIADFDTTSDNPQFPIEWAEPLTYNLAVRLEPTYRQLSAGRRAELREDAGRMLAAMLINDHDRGSIYISA